MTERRWAALLVLATVALALRAFLPTLGWGYTDADAWADVAWARHPLRDQLLVKLTGGVAGDDANFWRPAAMVQFWIERRLFGDDPRGWHAWDLGVHLLASLLAGHYVARQARFAGRPHHALATAATLAFVVYPLTEDVVPANARNLDLLLGVGVFGALGALVRLEERRRAGVSGGWGLLLLGVGLALGAKEAAVLLLGLCPLWVLLFRGDLPLRGRVVEAAKVMAPVAALTGVWLGVRSSVLGGVGGYYETIRADWVWAALGRAFIEPFVPSLSAWAPEDWRTTVPLTLVWAVLLRAGWRSDHRATVLFGAAWFLAATALFAATGTCSRRVYYVPTLAGLLVVLPALLHGWRTPIGAVLAGAWLLVFLHGSPAVVRYTQWAEAARASDLYRDVGFWERLPTGAEVWLADRPFRVDIDPRTFRFFGGRAKSLHHGAPAYAIQAWVDEALPERRLRVATLTGFALEAPVEAQEVVAETHDGALVIRHRGGERQRWDVRSPFTVTSEGALLRVSVKRPGPERYVVVWTKDGPRAWSAATGAWLEG